MRNDENLQRDVRFFEYTQAANPIAKGSITVVPFAEFPAELHQQGPTQAIAFDLSDKLGNSGPATSPNLCASFLHILPGEKFESKTNATSELFYVMRGNGITSVGDAEINWQAGDFFIVPGGGSLAHRAETDAAMYWVTDAPLLRYLGVTASQPQFQPTLYRAEDCKRELKRVEEDPKSKDRNRVSILLGNARFPQTMTATHTLWAMFGILPTDAVQPPHRHNSVALDLILDCAPGCYTLVSREIDEFGQLINPVRQDWKPYSAFVTPPYYWHSHHNESGRPANLIPIQDAGLQTYMRTLNIEFAHPVARTLTTLESEINFMAR